MDLGPESSFTQLPTLVDVGDWSYFLVKDKTGYKLLSNVCPHHGGEVLDQGNQFMCPDHGWRFEKTDGVCVNGPNAKMISFPVTIADGRLIADVPLE